MAGFEGSVALVTGAEGGIGRATALELASRGADVAVHYFRDQAGAEDVAREVRTRGRRAAIYQADLTKSVEVKRVFDGVQSDFGRVDVLVNNAGDIIGRQPLVEMTETFFHQVVDVNVLTTFLCCQAAAPGMIARKRGAIVNLASLAAHNGGGPGASVYAAAKAAVMTLTKAYAKELAPHGIRVNAVSPGLIGGTNFHGKHTSREAFEATVKTIPLGRAGEPADVARVIAFLAGGDAGYLTGETIEINGGMFMR
jgi:3-oxoacyl-[acyl-carrier protein] reductase